MSIAWILLPLIFLVVGIVFVIFPDQAGMYFCKIRKATWRITTFGLTDMRWFYREDKARRTGRMMGVMFILFGAIFSILLTVSFLGPNPFAAMREAGAYLEKTHGTPEGGWDLICWTSDGSSDVVVEYKYAGEAGALHGIWTGKNYIFTEQNYIFGEGPPLHRARSYIKH